MPAPCVFEPRERSAILASIITATAVLLWGVYLLANAESWFLDAVVLGGAVVASGGAITVICWYAARKPTAREHQEILKRQQKLIDDVAELRDDNRCIVAELQQLSTRLKDHYWSAYADGVQDSTPTDDTCTGVVPFRARSVRPDRRDYAEEGAAPTTPRRR